MKIINLLKQFEFFGNSAYDYLLALVFFLVLLIVLKVFQSIILSRLKKISTKTKTDFDDVLIDVFVNIKPPFYLLISLYFSFKFLVFPDIAHSIIKIFFMVAIIYEVIRAVEKLTDYVALKFLTKKESDGGATDVKQAKTVAGTINLLVKIALWVFGLTLILSNLGVDVTSLVAGLGIGGIAIALALQNVLGDLFSYFTIHTDKPFQVGDFVVVDGDSGTVSKIGLKSTRLITLQGEEMIISNKEMTGARIHNFKKMKKRRVVFSLGVVYGTSGEKLKKIPQLVKQAVEKIEKTEFSRCHFKDYGDFSLNFEIVYYVMTRNYDDYMEVNQQVNLDIYQSFGKEKIEFAYPTQKVFVAK